MPARELNRQELCLTWLPARLCCVPLYGATLLPHKQVCILTGRARTRVAGAPIGAGWVDGHGYGLYIGYEETVVPCCKQESNITKFICVICDHVLPVRLM